MLRPWLIAMAEERFTADEQTSKQVAAAIEQFPAPWGGPAGHDWDAPGARIEKLMRQGAEVRWRALCHLSEANRSFLASDDWQQLWDRGKDADHGRRYPNVASVAQRIAKWVDDDGDLAGTWLAGLGLAGPEPLVRDKRLVLLTVSDSSETEEGRLPTLAALARFLGDSTANTHLRLVVTPKVEGIASRIALAAERSHGFASAEPLPSHHVTDLPGQASAVRAALDSAVMDRVSVINAVTNPGSAVMNIAVLAGLAEQAFNRVVTVRLLSAVERHPTGQSQETDIVEDEEIDASLRRLASDALVGRVVADALPRLDYGLVVEAAGRGSPVWDDVGARAQALEAVLLHVRPQHASFKRLGLAPADLDDPAQVATLAVQRLDLLRHALLSPAENVTATSSGADPLRCVYAAYAVCDWARSLMNNNVSVRHRSQALSDMRNASPQGHQPEAQRRPIDTVDAAVREAQASFGRTSKPRALVTVHDKLVEDLG